MFARKVVAVEGLATQALQKLEVKHSQRRVSPGGLQVEYFLVRQRKEVVGKQANIHIQKGNVSGVSCRCSINENDSRCQGQAHVKETVVETGRDH